MCNQGREKFNICNDRKHRNVQQFKSASRTILAEDRAVETRRILSYVRFWRQWMWRFRVLRAVAPCTVVKEYQNFEETCCWRLQCRNGRFMPQVVSKCWYTSTEITDDCYLSKQNTLGARSHIRNVSNTKRPSNTTCKSSRLNKRLNFPVNLIRLPEHSYADWEKDQLQS